MPTVTKSAINPPPPARAAGGMAPGYYRKLQVSMAPSAAGMSPAPPADEEEDHEPEPAPLSIQPAGSSPASFGSTGPASQEEVAANVKKAQQRLVELERERERVERQKRELEDLARRQEELSEGRAELDDRLTRALAFLERDTMETERHLDLLRATTDRFAAHLASLAEIDPSRWTKADAPAELSRALGLVEIARNDFQQARAKLRLCGDDPAPASRRDSTPADDDADADPLAPRRAVAGGEHGFLYWLKAGFAFTLPLLLVGVMIFFILWWRTAGAA